MLSAENGTLWAVGMLKLAKDDVKYELMVETGIFATENAAGGAEFSIALRGWL